MLAHGVGGIGELVLANNQGVGGIGELVLAHGVGGIGELVLASTGWAVIAFRPIALVNINNAKATATNHLHMTPPGTGTTTRRSL